MSRRSEYAKPPPGPPGETAEEALTDSLLPQPVAGDDALVSAIARALRTDEDIDLTTVPDEDIVYQDTASSARIAYVLSLYRLNRFLRWSPESFGQLAVQAKIAQAHIRHIESSQLAALQLGRHRADELLDSAVNEARKRLDELARKKALLIGMGESPA